MQNGDKNCPFNLKLVPPAVQQFPNIIPDANPFPQPAKDQTRPDFFDFRFGIAGAGQEQDCPLRILRQGTQKLIYLASGRELFHASDCPDNPLPHTPLFTVTLNDLQIVPARRLLHSQKHGRLLCRHYHFNPCIRRKSRIISLKRGTTFLPNKTLSPSRRAKNWLQTVEERSRMRIECDNAQSSPPGGAPKNKKPEQK